MDNFSFLPSSNSPSSGTPSSSSFPMLRKDEYSPITKILLVEDNPGDARLVELLLEESDFLTCEIVNVTSLNDAIKEIKQDDSYEAILLDLTLPDSRGFETLERLLQSVPDANVIVLTGLSDRAIGINAVKAGAQDFLIKGAFDGDLLSKSLLYAIQRSSVIKRLEETQRVANIGSWEYNTQSKEFQFSTEVFRILDLDIRKEPLSEDEVFAENSRLKFLREIHTYVLEMRSIRKDMLISIGNDKKKHIFIQCRLVRKAADNFIINGIIQDITDRKQAEELRKAKEVAEQSALLKEQFIASVSHEMRTPMNAILGMSNLLLQSPLNSEQLGYLTSVKQSSEILLGIVNDILEISTLQNGKILFEYETFDLHEILNNMVNVMGYKMKEKDLKIEIEIEPDVPQYLKGDKLRLNQILYNLVGNGIKFTDNGIVKTTVRRISNDHNKIHLQFEIEDTGIGIPEDKLDAIFETFTRIRSKDRIYEGTGLGLSITKNLVLKQGGSIGASSKIGIGSIFVFDLMFDLGEQQEMQKEAKQNDVDIIQDRKLKLLLVEDHKMNQIVAKKTLEKQWASINVTIAENGQQAIEKLEKDTYDIVLMDIQMPIMDGYEATLAIRKHPNSAIASIPVLVMTAHAHIAKEEQFKQHGFDDFVLKPFEPNDLFYKVNKYARKS